MKSFAAKRRKMSDEIKETTQISSETKTKVKVDNMDSTFKYHHSRIDYIDKTMLIKKLFTISHILITAPSRFGKTLNMDMVRRFVEIEMDEEGKPIELERHNKGYLKDNQPKSKNFQYFEGKKIFGEKQFMSKHFGQYPTIYVDFHNVKGNNFEEILSQLRKSINQAFLQHLYLENSSLWNTVGYEKETFLRYVSTERCELLTEVQVQKGLPFLAACLYYHHKKKVYAFIDDFDVPINAMVYNNNMELADRDLTIQLLQLVVDNVLKGSFEFVAKSLLNGCQQLAEILSRNANVAHYPFIQGHEFCEFYGFLEEEVHDLLKSLEKTEYMEEIKKYYNGYWTKLMTGREISIYNPWAVTQFLQTAEFNTYLSAGIATQMIDAIGHPQIQARISKILNEESNLINYREVLQLSDIDILCKMLCGNGIKRRYEDLFLQILYEQGFFYLISLSDNTMQLGIPNKTVFNKIRQIVSNANMINSFCDENRELVNKFTGAIDDLAKSCTKKDVLNLAESVKNMMIVKEISFAHAMNFQFHLCSALETNKFRLVDIEHKTSKGKRCNIVIINDTSGVVLVIEVKYRSKYPSLNCGSAHEEIFVRGYDTVLDDASIKKLCPNFSGTIKKRIYLGIHINDEFKVSIRYSINGKNRVHTVFTEPHKTIISKLNK